MRNGPKQSSVYTQLTIHPPGGSLQQQASLLSSQIWLGRGYQVQVLRSLELGSTRLQEQVLKGMSWSSCCHSWLLRSCRILPGCSYRSRRIEWLPPTVSESVCALVNVHASTSIARYLQPDSSDKNMCSGYYYYLFRSFSMTFTV
jgi:hypothetical protein